MPLAIFDIDGTLIDSTAVDTRCFLDAFVAEFGVDASGVDPCAIVHYTDRGIVIDLFREFWSREPDEADISRHRSRYLAKLKENAGAIPEIAGARAFVGELRRRGWSVALATGAWRQSALLKLAAAGFDDDMPLVCCDDLVAREDIVRAAIVLAGETDPPVILFGDGVWDVRCAANLRLPIVGIGRGAVAEQLRLAGARVIIDDFADTGTVFAAMENACGRQASSE